MNQDHQKQVAATAKFLVQQFNKSGVQAITLGDRDTLLGSKLLRELHSEAKFPFLVANLLDAETGKPMFDEHTIVKVAGVKVGLFGVTMLAAERRAKDGTPMPWRVDNPIKVAGEQVKALKAKGAEVIVALAHLSKDELKNLATQVPGITAVLAGNGTRSMTHPDNEAGVFICEAHSKGKYLSVLTLHIWDNRKPSDPFVDRYKREGLSLEISKLDARLGSYQRLLEKKEAEEQKAKPGAAAGGPSRARAIGADYYRKQLVKMRAEKGTLEMELEEVPPADLAANYVVYSLEAVKKALPDEPAIGKDVTAFRVKYPKLKPGKRLPRGPAKRQPGTPVKRTKLPPQPRR